MSQDSAQFLPDPEDKGMVKMVYSAARDPDKFKRENGGGNGQLEIGDKDKIMSAT